MNWNLATILPLLMFPALFAAILTGFPVGFSIAGTAIVFGLVGYDQGLFQWSDFGFVSQRVFNYVQEISLIAVPLFIFMGLMLEKSGVANELLEAIQYLFKRIKGGLAIGVVLVGALLAASTGIVGATVVTMGAISLPTMLQQRYQKELACGTIAAAGTLGQIIPPSIVLVILSGLMNEDVGNLFVGAILPGLLLVLLYMTYIFIRVMLQPHLAPPAESSTYSDIDGMTLLRKLSASLAPPIVLITVVLGSILFGIAPPTEASACGAVGVVIIAGLKRKCSFEVLRNTLSGTVSMTAMVFMILIGAQFFSVVFRGLYGEDVIIDLVRAFELEREWVLAAIMIMMFFLGFFLDFIEICFIIVPIFGPILTDELGFDKLWISILFAVNLQTSFLTPPFGFALFYLKAVAPEGVRTSHIYRGIVPFVLLQIFCLGILYAFPEIILWLPRQIFGPTPLP